MQVIHKFNLEYPEDVQAHKRAVLASEMASLLFFTIFKLKKSMCNDLTPKEYEEGVLDTINYISNECIDRGIIIEELVC